MFNMYVTVARRTSTAISDLKVDALNRRALVTFKDSGATYEYVLFNPDISLGFWVNNNCIHADRVRDYSPMLPEFV